MDALTYEDNCTYTHEGVLFSGIGFELFPDGRTCCELSFVNGRQEGITRAWFETGQLESEEMYWGNGLHGMAREWYRNGRLKSEGKYEFGICLSSKEWNEQGHLLREFTLQAEDPWYEILRLKRSIWGKKGKR